VAVVSPANALLITAATIASASLMICRGAFSPGFGFDQWLDGAFAQASSQVSALTFCQGIGKKSFSDLLIVPSFDPRHKASGKAAGNKWAIRTDRRRNSSTTASRRR
jgi:hypothetical protein